MAEVPQASFIPKRTTSVPRRKKRVARRIYLISYAVYIFFFGTVLAALAVWLYGLQLNREIAATQSELATQSEIFAASDIDAVRNFKKKLILTEQILNESMAVSKVFGDIETFVSDAVTFTAFDYARLPSGRSTVSLTGLTDSFPAIMYQRNLMNQSNIFASAALDNYDYNTAELDETDSNDGGFGPGPLSISNMPVSVSFTYVTDFENNLIAYDGTTGRSTSPTVTEVRAGGDGAVSAEEIEPEGEAGTTAASSVPATGPTGGET